MVASWEWVGTLALDGKVSLADQPERCVKEELQFLREANQACWPRSVRWPLTWADLERELRRLDIDGWPDPPEAAVVAELLLYARACRLVVDQLPEFVALPERVAWLVVVLEDDEGARAALVDALHERWPFRQALEERVRIIEVDNTQAATAAVRASRTAGGTHQRIVVIADQRLAPEARRGADLLGELRDGFGTLPDRWLISGRATAREVGEAFERKSCSAFLPKSRSWWWMADRIWRCRMRDPVTSALQLVADLHPRDAVGRRLALCADLLLRMTPEELSLPPASALHETGQHIFRLLQGARDEVLSAFPEGPLPMEIAT